MIGSEVIMDIQEALNIMRALANGTNPQSGEVLEENSICRQQEAVRALNRAISALVVEQGREMKKPRHAFRTWTRAEDAQVCEELRKGMDFRDIAKAHDRDSGAAGEIGKDSAAGSVARIAATGGLRNYGFTGNHSHCDAGAGPK
jgi:hypothetical protein